VPSATGGRTETRADLGRGLVRPPGGPPDKYVLEGRRDGKWQEELDFDVNNTRVSIPTSETEGAQAWRLRAANEHGMGKPSDEVTALPVEESPENT